ncbi:uncharacterized protein [Anoplolepis gracilipes]|uniref:uncharacterized protein n=1 Tax=Anoplolepis gracilipes TaxID=354296 RepID=UPI003BA15550
MLSKMCLFSIYVFLCGIVQYNMIYAKRILVITNFPSYSHQVVYRGLCLELNKQGYEIVSVTPNPIKNSSLKNYREIDLNHLYNVLPEYKTLLTFKSITEASLQLKLLEVEESIIWPVSHILNHMVFKNEEMKKLYATDSNEHFDAVIVAQGPTTSLNAFAYRFNAPLIGISSMDVYNNLRYMSGSPILPSHISNWQANTVPENNMSFWRRLVNFCEVWKHIYDWMNVHIPIEDALAKKYLGEDLPHIVDITKNLSIYLVNKHPALFPVRPEQPNVIYFHGFHIAKVPPALPKDLKQFLDNATEGFIYVSLGTNINWEHLPNNTFESFVEVFSTLPYKVVWKYDPDLLPKKFENILASKWFPQQSILAHQNIKLFIYQGGVQSTEEAVYNGIPVIGFPIIWDQLYNMQYIQKLGVGVLLHYHNISKEKLQTAIYEVINNKRYKDQMKYLRELYNNGPYDSLQNVVRWIEYVIRQNGTPFLRNSLGDETWYRRYDWDIIGFFAIVIFVASLIVLWVLLQILRFHLRILSNSLHMINSGKMYRVICGMCVILSLWLLPANNITDAKRILVITFAPFYSHQIVYRSLCFALNKREHEIVILTPSPIRDPTLKNYTEIDTSSIISISDQYRKQLSELPSTELTKYVCKLIHIITVTVFDEPKFKKLYRNDSNEKFDAVIVEALGSPALFTMAYRFNAPLIGVMSLGIHNYQRYIFGSPILPSHSSNWELNTLVGENPSIWQRLRNFIETWSFIHYWITDFVVMEQEIAKKYLGSNIPQVIEITKNMSVLLVNENPITVFPRPGQTNAIYFSGFHIQKTLPPLQEDLGQFLDNATEGFIYVSFGTTFVGDYGSLQSEMLENFIEVFSKLPYKIVWKLDCNELPRKLDNILISKWFPQQNILAHQNIKLFIYQGGLQSTEEALYYAVPVLGIPIVSEQEVRVQRLVSLDAAIYLKLNGMTKEHLYAAIHQILNNKSYKERMVYLSSLFKDQSYDSMENVIWWIEFVMRHKKANLLRFSESDNPWYQRYDMDIIALLSTTLFILTCIIVLIIFQILKFIFRIF